MAASMTLGGTQGMSIGMGTGSPIVSVSGGIGGLNNMTPSHSGGKYGGHHHESGSSSIHSPISTHNSTPSSTITINSTTIGPGSMGKCSGATVIRSNSDSGGMMGGNTGNLMTNSNPQNENSDIFGSKCKRKINFSNLGMPGRAHQPATVARRNARERNRVKQVNNGFAALKQHIPLGHRSKKMSKVETLRCAVDYIRNLQGMLNIHPSFSFSIGSPADSTMSNGSGDILMEDGDEEEDETEQQQQQQLLEQNQNEINGVSNQREMFALSSATSSTSSSPTNNSSEFSAAAVMAMAHLPHNLNTIHSHQNLSHSHHQQQQQLISGSNQGRQLSLSHHHHHHHHHHPTSNGVAVAAAALLMGAGNNGVTPNQNQLSPTSSDGPSSPSYNSEVSYVNSNGNLKGNGLYDYEKYEPVSPEDEELLDAIAWWQQS